MITQSAYPHSRSSARRDPGYFPASRFTSNAPTDLATLRSNDRFVQRLKEHDIPAFELLVEKCTPRLLAVAKRFLHNAEDAADAVQDTFLLAYVSIERFQGRSSVYTWLHRILVNACLMKLRSRHTDRSISFQALVSSSDSWNGPLNDVPAKVSGCQLEGDEMKAFVRDCIEDLPEDYRKVIWLRDIEQMDTADTARLLKITPGAVKTRLHRARVALRALLESVFEGIIDPRIAQRNPVSAVASN